MCIAGGESEEKGCIVRKSLVMVSVTLAVFLSVLASPSDGLAAVGPMPEADLTRAQLPDGLRQLASDQAIEMANDPRLADARENWSSDSDFVDQIDYQLKFRAQVDFMSSDPEYLGELLVARPTNMGIEEMGLYMSDEEAAEMRRRDALGDKMEALVEQVTGVTSTDVKEGVLPDYGPNFGGIWQDQTDGGRILLAVVDASQLDVASLVKAVGDADSLVVIRQEYTYNETEAFRDKLESELDGLGIAGDVMAVSSGEGRLLQVRVQDPGLLPDSFGSSVPEGAFRVVQGAPSVSAGAVNTTHAWADEQPGLRVTTWESGNPYGDVCTWGFNGHTSGYNYIIMAGHCMPPSYKNVTGSWVELSVMQNGDSGSHNLTPGWSFLRSLDGTSHDVLRISSSYADDNCYHGSGSSASAHCQYTMSYRALHNSWETGSDRSCASLGNSNAFRCGYILEEGINGGTTVRVGVQVIGGDSGAGFMYGSRIDGILRDRSATEAYFESAYYVQVALGSGYFYFNCAYRRATHSDPSGWGSCPAIDA